MDMDSSYKSTLSLLPQNNDPIPSPASNQISTLVLQCLESHASDPDPAHAPVRDLDLVHHHLLRRLHLSLDLDVRAHVLAHSHVHAHARVNDCVWRSEFGFGTK
ncbi:hypothetical protein VTL71DRAFT_13343 [Oculimacula yallundae]|uniref:Uncharacterized protein n=1 Tax=Oculimacula yallundae TaxID=86028 RepID=A0ABR4CKP9_9HELO